MMTPGFPPPGRGRFNATLFIVLLGLAGLIIGVVVLVVWVALRVVAWLSS